MSGPKVILVNSDDVPIGEMEKMDAHIRGELHRAFSVLVFNSKGEMLLQKRAPGKYHSPGLWTNACCSHPSPNHSIETDVKNRLRFEMGLESEVSYEYKFEYRIELEGEMIEHELDYVYTAITDDLPVPNPDEVASWKYISMNELYQDLEANPGEYTHWFKLIMDRNAKKYLLT